MTAVTAAAVAAALQSMAKSSTSSLGNHAGAGEGLERRSQRSLLPLDCQLNLVTAKQELNVSRSI